MGEIGRLSASYDVDIAKEHGLPAAALLNKIIYLSKFTPREDGFCWRTAQEIEEELGITKRQQSTAVEKLEQAGLIETKITYIQGTTTKCKHFRIITSESDKMLLSGSDETSLSNSNIYNNRDSNIVIKHNNGDFGSLWAEYPKKQGKDKAYKAYTKARKEGVTDEVILKGIKAYKNYIAVMHTEDQYIKQGGTWFYQQCWNDDYSTAGNSRPSGKTRLQDRHDYDYAKIEEELFGEG